MSGKVYGVALGPGDPELITLKALRCLQQAEKIYFPASQNTNGEMESFSMRILQQLEVDENKFAPVIVPMSKNRDLAEQAYADLAARIADDIQSNIEIAVVSEGDISFFSTFSYLLNDFRNRNINFEMIPGVPAFILGGSLGKRALVSQNEKLLVVPNLESEAELRAHLQNNQTVVLMKISKVRNWIADFIEREKVDFFYGEYLGTDKEFTCKEISELKARRIPYFAIIIFYGNH